MSDMVETVANETMTPQADTADSGVVSASELMGDTPQTVEEQPLQAEGTQDDAAPKTFTKAEVDALIKQKAGYIEQGYEKKRKADPALALGEFLIRQSGEKDPLKGAEKIRQKFLQEQAEALAQDPSVLAQMFLESQAPKFTQDVDVKESADRITTQLIECIENEELPEDFNPTAFEKANPGFLDYAARRGVSAAYIKFNKPKENASPQIANMLAQAHNLPKPTRPTTPVPNQPIDYTGMSSAEFRKIEERMKAIAANGGKVIL